jgi:hypothetical protein
MQNRMPGGRIARLDGKALVELVLEAIRRVDEKKLSPPAPSRRETKLHEDISHTNHAARFMAGAH